MSIVHYVQLTEVRVGDLGDSPVFANRLVARDQMKNGLSPVSYTHLDVYKRQVIMCGRKGLLLYVKRMLKM